MAADGKDCETQRDGASEPIPQGRRILPEEQPPAHAWTENEEALSSSPGESRRLLPSAHSPKQKSQVHAGVTLAVQPPGKYTKCPQFSKPKKPKTKFQKIEEKFCTFSPTQKRLLAFLKPPYFICTMTFIMLCVHVSARESVRSRLLWSPCRVWSEPWRLVSYALLHGDNMHLTMNVIVGLAVCWVLEREQRWWRVAALWMCGVAAGAGGARALQPTVQVVGASAAVYALLTSHIPNVCLRYGHVPLWWFRLLSVAVLVSSDACWWLAWRGGDARAVAWSAHILGASVGLLLGFIVYTGENASKPSLWTCRVVSATVLVSGLTWFLYTYWGPCSDHLETR